MRPISSQKFAVFFGVALLVTTVVGTAAPTRDDVLGCWIAESGDSVLEIQPDGDGLVGRIVALDEPFYEPGENAGRDGKLRLDDQNPDPQKRKQPVLGLDILRDFQFESGWKGKIYDPRSGDTYESTLKVVDEGRLELRGYLGFAWLGRSVFYVPATSRAADRDRLFEKSKTRGPCAQDGSARR